MKRLGLAAAAGCVLAGTLTGLAGADSNYAKDRDWVHGAIKRTSLNGQVRQHHEVDAWETSKGGVAGHYTTRYADPVTDEKTGYTGRITCIRVVGSNATIGVEVQKGETRPDVEPGDGQVIRVTNYGNGNGDSSGQKDSVSPGAITATPPTSCPLPIKVKTPTTSGNVVVHDGD